MGEEYAFRGYLIQAFGGLFRQPWVAIVCRACCSRSRTACQNAPLFLDRFAFGLVAGFLVFRTGGLEAGIALHVLNNLLAFGLALLFGDIGDALNPTGGSWWNIPVTLAQSRCSSAWPSWCPPDGAADGPRTQPFWRRPAPRVRFLPVGPRARLATVTSREAVTIGIWCNWQHDWFWSS